MRTAQLTHKFVIFAVVTGVFMTPFTVRNVLATGIAATHTMPVASVYRWQQSVTGDWQSPSNWKPARTTPASSDILIFNFGGTTTPTNVPTESIGQLVVTGNTSVNLQSATQIVLTIVGGDGNDLTIEQNSALNFNGSTAITLNLASGATAHLYGSMTFSSHNMATHKLTAIDPFSITFENGSVFTAAQGFTGNPFGTTNLNSVIFALGSTYVCFAGGDPFGATEPASVVQFQAGSLFSLRGYADTSFSQTTFFSGRTYANFELNFPGAPFASGTSPFVINDLAVRDGTLHYFMTGSDNSIKGNITTMPGTRLDLQGGFPKQIVNINGNAPQTLSIGGNIGVNPANTIAIDNPAGVLVNGVFGAWNLNLVNGIVSIPDPAAFFFVSGTVSRTNGYINGYVSHWFSEPENFVFPVGTEIGYAPVVANVTAGNFSSVLEVRPVEAVQPNVPNPPKALSRYWTVGKAGDLTADLTFHYLDADIPITANEQNFVIQRYNGTAFVQQPGVIDTVANTFRVNGVTDFVGDWTLVESGTVASPTPTASPTATSTPLASVSGTVTYGNAIGAPSLRFVSNVTVTGTGASTIFTTTIFPNGDYSLTGFQPGAYTVTPSKTDGVNGISSFDAAKIAQHAAGVSILTGNQLVVADVSGNGTISSFDAGQIARFAAGLSGFGSTGNWIFTPANRNYASVTGNIAGEDFVALLMGEVSGNWTNTAAR